MCNCGTILFSIYSIDTKTSEQIHVTWCYYWRPLNKFTKTCHFCWCNRILKNLKISLFYWIRYDCKCSFSLNTLFLDHNFINALIYEILWCFDIQKFESWCQMLYGYHDIFHHEIISIEFKDVKGREKVHAKVSFCTIFTQIYNTI